MFSQASVILSTIGLMPSWPLLILVDYSVTCYGKRSVRILLEYILVLSDLYADAGDLRPVWTVAVRKRERY